MDRARRRSSTIDPTRLFSIDDPSLIRDALLLIVDFLTERGLTTSASVLRDEARLNQTAAVSGGGVSSGGGLLIGMNSNHNTMTSRISEACREGDWETLRGLSKRVPSQRRRAFLYAVVKQEFLELVEQQESQLAFAFFTRWIKPLEGYVRQVVGEREVADLLYVATCRSPRERFRDWDGVSETRERLQRDLVLMMDSSSTTTSTTLSASSGMIQTGASQHRLMALLQQAYAHQIESSRAHPSAACRVNSLLVDYSCVLVPDTQVPGIFTHSQSVKCLTYVGPLGRIVASGCNDGIFSLWKSETSGTSALFSTKLGTRIWDVTASTDGSLVAAACADGSVTLWSLDLPGLVDAPELPPVVALAEQQSNSNNNNNNIDDALCREIAKHDTTHEGDVYSIKFHPNQRSLLTTGWDRTARLIDIETGQCVRTFVGHEGSVTHADFTPNGSLIATASKDATVLFFDPSSGVAVKTFAHFLGEVSSVQVSGSGNKLLTSCKDSTIRVWDVRAGSTLSRCKGHSNSSKNFIRASFGARDAIVLSGSQDGTVFVWDTETGRVIQRLWGHRGAVFRAVWNEARGEVATCAEDATVRRWSSSSS